MDQRGEYKVINSGSLKNKGKQHKQYKQYKQHRQGGWGLIEIIIVLAIISILVVLVIALGTKATSKAKDQNITDTVEFISKGINEMYASTGNYTGLVTADAIPLAPKNILHGAGAAQVMGTPWYGGNNASTITLEPTPTNSQFIVTLNQIPNDDCTKIGGAFFNVAASISANAVVAANPHALATQCAAGAGGNSDLALTFN
ncbi:type 4 pilus major pilin [Cysteiniphilum halobium]|uniref:type 4 pilus major pilin n=1 Tax=Cysteiniphilum halobium TaxID=2219059 RepID=UPI000E6483F1|nr:type 4 pilus major pilin [Cysteiniphilum halobium]